MDDITITSSDIEIEKYAYSTGIKWQKQMAFGNKL